MKPDKAAFEVANGEIVHTEGIGTVGSINNVYFIPGFGHNLLSVVQMNKRGYIVQQENKRGARDRPVRKWPVPVNT